MNYQLIRSERKTISLKLTSMPRLGKIMAGSLRAAVAAFVPPEVLEAWALEIRWFRELL